MPQASVRYTRTSDGVDIGYAVVGDGDPAVVAEQIVFAGLDVSLGSEAFMRQHDPLLRQHSVAARVGDWGQPGQVLCSRVVRDLLLGKGFEGEAVGQAELKGFDQPTPVYEVRS